MTRDPKISATPLYLLLHFSLLQKRCRNGCGRKTKKYEFYEDSIDANLLFYLFDLIRDKKNTSQNNLILCKICTLRRLVTEMQMVRFTDDMRGER